MITPFSGAKTEHWYVAEATAGITPAAPVWTKIRNTGFVPSLSKDPTISNELDGSRENTNVRTGSKQVTGEIPVLLSQTSQDELIAGAMTSQWVTGVTGLALDITVDDASKTFTRATGDFVSDGVLVGDTAYFADLTGNNSKPFTVTAVTATEITAAGITLTLVDETETTDYRTADKIGTGSLCKSVSILTKFTGECGTSTAYQIATGVQFTGFSYEIAVNADITGSFPFIGKNLTTIASPPAGSTYTTELTTRAYHGVDGKVLSDNVVQALFTSATITNDNAASAQYELGSNETAFIERGNATNTISVSAFMYDNAMIERFVNEDETSFTVILVGIDGAMSFTLPKTFITAATPEIGGATSITQTVEATGTGNSNESSIIVQRLTY